MYANEVHELCFFVGGNGNKTGVEIAGGCTKEWLAAQNGDPSGLFGANGACIYSSPSIQIGTNYRITGAAGTFAGVQTGMVAWIQASNYQWYGYYEVTAVGSQFEYVEFAGTSDDVFSAQLIAVSIGGAFDSLATAWMKTPAYWHDGFILTNKNETLTSTFNHEFSAGSMENSTFMYAIGYSTSVFVENGRVVSDMDPGKAAYQGNLEVLQNGITAGKKIILDGSGISGHVLSILTSNFIFRHIHIKAHAGYSCMQPDEGNAPQYTGIVFENCIFEGGQDGVKMNGLTSACRNCIALNSSGYGFNLMVNTAGKPGVIENCIADGCGTGFAASGGGDVQGCIAEDCTKGIESNGLIQVSTCVLYNCLEAAFACSNVLTRWEIFNTIAVLNENAGGVFKVGPNGGNIVYEDYNCFIDRLGNAVSLHDESTWPEYNYNPPEIGVHTLQTDPLFVSASGKDYRLQDSSPCVNAGRPVLYGTKTHIGIYEPAESVPDEGGNNVQSKNNRQYGTRNRQYN